MVGNCRVVGSMSILNNLDLVRSNSTPQMCKPVHQWKEGKLVSIFLVAQFLKEESGDRNVAISNDGQ